MSITRPGAAIFASSFAPHIGGVEELTRRLAIEQRRRGADTIVVTNRYPKTLTPSEHIDGIPLYRERFRFPEPRPRHVAGWLAGTTDTRRGVRQALTKHQCRIVHVQCVSTNAYYALRAARHLGLPLVVTMQGELSMDASGIYRRSALMRRTWRSVLEAAVAVTGCSQQVVDEAVAAYGDGLREKISVIPNGIDVSAVRSAEPEQRARPYLLGIGRFVPQKGFDLLIDAFASVAADWPDIELVLAGDGPERAALEARAGECGAASRIAFVGPVAASRAFSLFRGATGFVLPSRHEPQGIVVIEAMAAATPIVAARVGGVPETVRDGENGLLVPGGDASALAAGLRALLTDPGAARTRTASASRDVQNYEWARIADAYESCYDAAISAQWR